MILRHVHACKGLRFTSITFTHRDKQKIIFLSYFRFFNIVWPGVPHYQTIKFQAKRGQYRISRFLLSLIAIWNIHSSSGVTIKFSETAETWEQTYREDQVGSTQQQQTHFNALLAKVTRFLHFYRQMHEIFSFSYFALKINDGSVHKHNVIHTHSKWFWPIFHINDF